jgi:hypothetical protein
MNEVDRSTAIVELNKWLDAIDYEDGRIVDENIVEKIEEEKPEEDAEEKQNKAGEKILIKAVCDGFITFGDDMRLNLELKNPIKAEDGQIILEKLHFKTRLATWEYNKAMKGIKPDDADKRMLATIAAFSNVASSRIDRMSTKEIRILQVIAGYLL